MDNSIVQKRLLTHSTVILANTANVDAFAKVSIGLLGEGEDGSAAAHRNVVRALELIELEHSKAKRAKTIASQEIGEYGSLGKDIDAKIVETKQEIALLKKELRKEKYVRQRREECEALAKEVNEIDSRDVTSREIAAVNEELADKKKIQDATKEELELRKKQFHLLMQSIQSLKPALSEDTAA